MFDKMSSELFIILLEGELVTITPNPEPQAQHSVVSSRLPLAIQLPADARLALEIPSGSPTTTTARIKHPSPHPSF